MSYEQHIKNFCNHRKDKTVQQCGGAEPGAFSPEKSCPVDILPALTVLDQIEELRRYEKQRNEASSFDLAMRIACSRIAQAAGYNGPRTEWLSALAVYTPKEEQLPEKQVSVLGTLARMEEWRKKHQMEPSTFVDHGLRCASAMVAKQAGFTNRNEWTALLKSNHTTLYYRDYFNPNYPAWVW